MKKLGLLIKEETQKVLKERLKDSDGFLLVGYSGLSASDLNVLRNSLSGVDSSLMVIKNSVSKRVLESHQELQSRISGPCGLIFVGKDLISTTRVIYEFLKRNANLEVKAGFLKDRIVTEEEIKALSRIPSLSALHSRLLGGLKFPISGFVFSLKQILNKLVWALSQVKDKKKQ
ncbi:MAG: 50S ribosomal protein L10 [Candidatus Omnitrophota bacterium]